LGGGQVNCLVPIPPPTHSPTHPHTFLQPAPLLHENSFRAAVNDGEGTNDCNGRPGRRSPALPALGPDLCLALWERGKSTPTLPPGGSVVVSVVALFVVAFVVPVFVPVTLGHLRRPGATGHTSLASPLTGRHGGWAVGATRTGGGGHRDGWVGALQPTRLESAPVVQDPSDRTKLDLGKDFLNKKPPTFLAYFLSSCFLFNC